MVTPAFGMETIKLPKEYSHGHPGFAVDAGKNMIIDLLLSFIACSLFSQNSSADNVTWTLDDLFIHSSIHSTIYLSVDQDFSECVTE